MPLITPFVIARGRISRSTYCSRLVLLGVACAALGTVAASWLGNNASALFSGFFVYSASALSCQRLHDTSRSGWALLWLLLPVLGPLWVGVQLLKRGAVGSNRYGADPSVRTGYLTVDIER
ncbi:DUF805 domain-containing protein [Pseudomonas japonica]|uniref:DUF805 domain-containing protein n=1 Tax=Pseudomonas japonica TaxID=256466 RepID=UPI0015E3BC92|nr:DUF805 domain-containing protein [Pseudomonas japonica]MBA1244230.1 DUF805 domain-containing protein [Pseudomonas japonica]